MARIIDVVQFLDEAGNEIVHREPEWGPGDLRLGSQVIVRESQQAVFFRDGKALDVLKPGRHTLTTANIPILSGLIGLATNGKTPFPAEVVFVNMRQFIDQKWGTPEPIVFRDPDLGMVRLRSFGAYTFQVNEPVMFVNSVVGQQGIFTTGEVQDYLRGMIIQRLTDILGEQGRSLLDLPGQYNEISTMTRMQLDSDFAALGLTLTALYINAITPTEETARAIDERSSMGAIGNMNAYLQYKAAQALGDAANNPGGGEAGVGVGLGAGMGMGAGMVGMLSQAFQMQSPAATPPQPAQPSPPAAEASGTIISREQVQQAIDNLDMRFSMGEMSEATYQRLVQKWQTRLQEMGR